MRRLLLALTPWMAATAAFAVQSRTAQVTYTHHAPIRDAVVRVADECFVPVYAVEAWGWKVDAGSTSVKITAEGKQIEVPIRTVSNRQAIALRGVFEKLGAQLEWVPGTDNLVARSRIKAIQVDGDRVSVDAGLPLAPKIFSMQEPSRLVVDIPGAYLEPTAKLTLPENARAKQFLPDTVRVVVETPNAADLAKAGVGKGSFLAISLKPGVPSAIGSTEVAPLPVTADPSAANPDPASAPVQSTIKVTNVPEQPADWPLRVDAEDDQAVSLRFVNLGRLSDAAYFRKPEAAVIEIVLPGAEFALPSGFKLASESVLDTSVYQEGQAAVIRMRVPQSYGVDVVTNGREVTVQLLKKAVDKRPEGGEGLAGKVVVVDAGHGGKDTGANHGGAMEKALTLAIAKETAEALAAQGATVIMTRTKDEFISLGERAEIANRNNADLFVSIHINSNKVANSTSGGITFHHKASDEGRRLAECIQAEIAKVSKIPSIGVWSDGKIYNSGFAVLRNTRMPGVLIEMGFINHSKDRTRMKEAEFQSAVAGAIVKGLKVYLGDGS